jgi:N-acetyl-anhydromuramyl-L-alanine amidase AmpD
MNITFRPSPNQNARPGVKPDLIVLHGSEGTDAGDAAWLLNRDSKVSYHYLVQRTGAVLQFVQDAARAWHAGASSWKGRADCNNYSIGVALSIRQGETPTGAQYASLARLLDILMRGHAIPMNRVVGHYHVSPGRKTDPWPPFDWARLWEEMRKV